MKHEFNVGDFVKFNHEKYPEDCNKIRDEIGMIWEIFYISSQRYHRVFYAGIPHAFNASKLWTFGAAHLIKV